MYLHVAGKRCFLALPLLVDQMLLLNKCWFLKHDMIFKVRHLLSRDLLYHSVEEVCKNRTYKLTQFCAYLDVQMR